MEAVVLSGLSAAPRSVWILFAQHREAMMSHIEFAARSLHATGSLGIA